MDTFCNPPSARINLALGLSLLKRRLRMRMFPWGIGSNLSKWLGKYLMPDAGGIGIVGNESVPATPV